MANFSLPPELTFAGLAVFYLCFGLGAIWFAKAVLKIESTVLYISLLLIPALVHVMMSGQLGSLKAPGGLEAKFVKVSEQSVEFVAETIDFSAEDMTVVAKAGAASLIDFLPQLDESKPIVLTLRIGHEGYYDVGVWRAYFEALAQFRSFACIVLLDEQGRFFAYMESTALLGTLRLYDLGEKFVQAINEGDKESLRMYSRVVTDMIDPTASNVEALQKMTTQNVEFMVVVDGDGRLRGIVSRQQIVSRLMLAVTQ